VQIAPNWWVFVRDFVSVDDRFNVTGLFDAAERRAIVIGGSIAGLSRRRKHSGIREADDSFPKLYPCPSRPFSVTGVTALTVARELRWCILSERVIGRANRFTLRIDAKAQSAS